VEFAHLKEIIEAHKEKVKKLGYSEEQAEEIIHRVSAMMSAFIDAAWGTHPAQLSQRANDKKSLASVKECVNIELPTNQSSHKSE
tara:strand:+ start:9722 stop:9976 length:255 start_codon:yes stop_codon:yes gene_type:complete